MTNTIEEKALYKEYLEYPEPFKNEPVVSRVSKLRDWATNWTFYLSPYRIRRWALWRLADLFHDGDQWPTVTSLGYVGQQLATYYAPDDLYLGLDVPPRPVLNEYKDHILNESARLNRSDYEPEVITTSNDPSWSQRQGARIATRALRTSLQEENWTAKKRMISHHLPSYGGAWVVSRWDVSMDDVVRRPVAGCCACAQCGYKFAGLFPEDGSEPPPCPVCVDHPEQRDPTPEEMMVRADSFDPSSVAPRPPDADAGMGENPPYDHEAALADAMREHVAAPVDFRAPGGPPLQDWTPIESELYQNDYYGRPLGEDVPRGVPTYDVYMPYDVFEAEFGIGSENELEVRDATLVKVRGLDWIRSRYPNARVKEFLPENAFVLHDYHPIAGEFHLRADRSLWRNSSRVIQRIRMPWLVKQKDDNGQDVLDKKGQPVYKRNKGRVVTVASDIVLEDAELMVTGPDGREFPRVLVTYTPHDLQAGGQERLGSSLARQLFDAQRGINISFVQDLDEQKYGQSKWLASSRANLSFGNESGGAAGVVRWSPPEDDPNAGVHKPELVSRTGPSPRWGGLADFCRGFMARTSRQQDVESGKIPSPDTPAAAMQIAREESSEVRKPRVAALGNTYERLFRHRLQLMQRYVLTPRVAWDERDSGEQFQRWWVGADFAGQTEVRIDLANAADTDLVRAAKRDTAIQRGLVDLENPRVRRIMGRESGVPAEVYEEDDAQETAAEREFSQYTADCDPDSPMGLRFGQLPAVDDGLDQHDAHAWRHRKDLHGDLWGRIERAVRWEEVAAIIAPWKLQFMDLLTAMAIQQHATTVSLDVLRVTPTEMILQVWATLLKDAGFPVDRALMGVLAFRAHLSEHELRLRMAQMPPSPTPGMMAPGMTPGAPPPPGAGAPPPPA